MARPRQPLLGPDARAHPARPSASWSRLRRSCVLALCLGAAPLARCAPVSLGQGGGPSGERVEVQHHPGELWVWDRAERRRYRVDLVAQRCYEVLALIDRCPPEGDHALCPRSRAAVHAANRRARAEHTAGGCERDGCADVESHANCNTVRELDARVEEAMGF